MKYNITNLDLISYSSMFIINMMIIIFFPNDFSNFLIYCKMNSNFLFILIIFLSVLMCLINLLFLYKLVSFLIGTIKHK